MWIAESSHDRRHDKLLHGSRRLLDRVAITNNRSRHIPFARHRSIQISSVNHHKMHKAGSQSHWTARYKSHETHKMAFENCFHECNHLIISTFVKLCRNFWKSNVKNLPTKNAKKYFKTTTKHLWRDLGQKLRGKENISLILAFIAPCAWNACKWLNVKDHGFIQQVVDFNFPVLSSSLLCFWYLLYAFPILFT